MNTLRLRWAARFGFFLRAEASNAGLSYPVPPRSAALGLCANVLGIPKDALAEELAGAEVAIIGAMPSTHWHCGNHRKDPPAALPYRVKAGAGGRKTKAEKNTQLRQEWLVKPSYELLVRLPGQHHEVFCRRVKEGTPYFSPCMGLSEMLAELKFLGVEELSLLAEGRHKVVGLVRLVDGTEVDAGAALDRGLHIVSLSMPRAVDRQRRFVHASYLLERDGEPIPVHTDRAWSSASGPVMFS